MKEFENQPAYPIGSNKRLFCLGTVDYLKAGEEKLPSEKGSRIPAISEEERLAFIKLTESLRKRGATVEIIPNNSPENASYGINSDVIIVHENDFFDAYEEAIHRAQMKILERLGFSRNDIGANRILNLAAETGASTKVAEIAEQRLQPIEAKIEGELYLDSKEIELAVRLGEVTASEHSSIRDYQTSLFYELKAAGKDELEKYRTLFEHPLFAGSKAILNQINLGFKSPMYASHSQEEIDSCLVVNYDTNVED